MTVFRFSRGIACRPRVVSAKTVLMSVGTVVRSAGITSPSFSTGPLPLRGQQLDVLLADGGHAVYLGFDVGGDLDLRVQRQHRRDAGVGQVNAFHRADLRAAVGDVAPRIQPSGLGQLNGHPVLPDTQHLGQPHVPEDHDRQRRGRHQREDRHLDEDPSRQNHVRAPDPSDTERSTGCRRRSAGRSACTGWGSGRWCGPTASPARSDRTPTAIR